MNQSLIFDLQIMTDDETLAAACRMYWELNETLGFVYTTAEISDLTGIETSKLAATVRGACRAVVPGWTCNQCGNSYVLPSRSDFNHKRSYFVGSAVKQLSFICDECQRKNRETAEEAQRVQVAEERRRKEELDHVMRLKIEETYALSKRQPVDIGGLSLTDAVYLLALLRGGACENLSKIIPVAMFEQPLSPDQEFSTEIINHLWEKRLIHVHPDSEPEAFKEGDIDVFFIYHVYYAPPISQRSPDDPAAIFAELTNKINSPWREEWYQQGLSLWQRVALGECTQYLLFVLREHHLEFSPGEKTAQYLKFALEHFSTAQVFNTIWRAGKDAAAYLQREGISKRQAANAAVASIQKITERAIADGWDVKPYGRNYNLPQSTVSEVLYNLALKVGEDGFRSVPNLNAIRTRKGQE